MYGSTQGPPRAAAMDGGGGGNNGEEQRGGGSNSSGVSPATTPSGGGTNVRPSGRRRVVGLDSYRHQSERSMLGNRMFVASALNPLGMQVGGKTPRFEQANEEVPFFDMGRPGSRMENETLRSPTHMQPPLLNLGEFLVEGVTMQDPNAPADEHGVFESFFDLTKPRLKMIFDALDRSSSSQREGVADFQHLRQGLADAGVKVDDETAFARLVSIVDQDLDGGLTFNEFEAVVQSLKMAYLMRTVTDDNMKETLGDSSSPKVKVLDYSVARVAIRYPSPQDVSLFLYGPRPDFSTTRWVDVTSPCDFVMKGLAIKYRFHPLSLEDALHLEFDNTAKVDTYDNHLFLVFPGMVLETYENVPRKSSQVYDGQERFPRARRTNRLLRSTSNSFRRPLLALVPPDDKDEEDTSSVGMARRSHSEQQKAMEEDEVQDDVHHILSAFPGVEHFNVCLFLTWPEADTLVSVVDQAAGGAVFRRVREELQVSYSRLRSQNALFLMYTILDVLVDGYIPIMDAFETHLASLRIEVRENAARKGILFDPQADTQFLARYHDVLHELNRTRRRISPAIRVIHHLTEIPEMDAECRIYLRDVLDHAQDVIERLEGMIEDCRALKVEQQSANDGKLTKSMAALTVVGVIFLPAQFLTGVFGMNFKRMPGINSDWGFFLFCVATLASWAVMWILFRRYHVV